METKHGLFTSIDYAERIQDGILRSEVVRLLYNARDVLEEVDNLLISRGHNSYRSEIAAD